MSRLHLFGSFLLAFVLISCGRSGQSADQDVKQSDSMAQFSEDPEFKDAHEEPAELPFYGKGKITIFNTTDGTPARAYILLPGEPTDNVLLVIHEWWGLNDHIKREADRLFDSLGNVKVLALDLYDGRVARDADTAGKYVSEVKEERARAVIQGAFGLMGPRARIATIGWCFGGGWSLKASIMAGNQGIGCVMYYGMPVQNAADLGPLKADVLGIFANKDGFITPEVVQKFEANAELAQKDLTVRQFDADHAFANPSSPRYNEEAAQEANRLAMAFLRERL